MIAFWLIVTALNAGGIGYWIRGWEQRATDRADMAAVVGLGGAR